MTAPFRCVIFAAVSSSAQAEDERGSIPSQIANSRAMIERRGWEEVADPLVVPGQSRSIDFLHEALAEIPALAELIELARQGEINLVVVRDYDRLARTRTLMAQLSAYLSRCRVQVYALNKPVEPQDPDQLGRRGQGVRSAAMIEALAGLESEGEVARIVERRHFGMNTAMSQGKWRQSKVVYGYTRKRQEDGKTVHLDVPVVVTEEAEIIRQMEKLYLDGLGGFAIARELNLRKVPSPGGKRWYENTTMKVLKNPFYCGYIVWGLVRTTKELDPASGSFVTKRRTVPAIRRLRKQLGRAPTVFDLLPIADELEKHDVIVVRGEHEPIRTEQRQRELYAEIARRRTVGGRAADTSSRQPAIFSGLLVCATCGSPYHAQPLRGSTRYYTCRLRRHGGACTNKEWVREQYLYTQVMGILQEIANNPEALNSYLEDISSQNVTGLTEERAGLARALDEIAARQHRWEDAYESGAIDLETYGRRLSSLNDEQESLAQRLSAIQKELGEYMDTEHRRQEIMQTLQGDLPILEDNHALVKVWLRKIIERITVRNGEVEEIKLY